MSGMPKLNFESNSQITEPADWEASSDQAPAELLTLTNANNNHPDSSDT
jgi:hypothetical protein